MYTSGANKTKLKTSNASGLDSNQLLSLCNEMRETMSQLDKSMRSAQLYLTTLSYIDVDTQGWSLKCIDNLMDLCKLSQKAVRLLDELHLKMRDSAQNSIQYQIASQQLMFFTSEWYETLTPQLNSTFELAEKQNLKQQYDGKKQTINNETLQPINSGEMRVNNALLRLRQSMGENERLIGTIASNIDYTRATIESIQDSLHSTKLTLYAGEQNAIESVKVLRQSNRYQAICIITFISILLIVTYLLLRLLL